MPQAYARAANKKSPASFEPGLFVTEDGPWQADAVISHPRDLIGLL
jgi:hypothetical protein